MGFWHLEVEVFSFLVRGSHVVFTAVLKLLIIFDHKNISAISFHWLIYLLLLFLDIRIKILTASEISSHSFYLDNSIIEEIYLKLHQYFQNYFIGYKIKISNYSYTLTPIDCFDAYKINSKKNLRDLALVNVFFNCHLKFLCEI